MGIAVLQAIGSFAAGAIAWVVLEFFDVRSANFTTLEAKRFTDFLK
jgi:hypothetical protein